MTRTPLLMGIVNVTPDSFSDGGRFLSVDAAIAHGRELLAQGADILDIGGESTRPGATRPVVEEELARVLPVVAALAQEGATVSVDTMRSQVAAAALEAGCAIVNDVSGGLADPLILKVTAASDAAYVAMHWRAHGEHMQARDFTDYGGDVVGTVLDELGRRLDAAREAGIPDDRLVLDPGLGFSKTAEQNWELLRSLDRFVALGRPVLVGASRKTFLGRLLAEGDGHGGETLRPTDQREFAHTAILALLAGSGAWAWRVHDVRAASDTLAAVRMLA